MPYAAKATVEHEFLTNLLKIYVTFRNPMRRSDIPQTTPPVFNWYPATTKWKLKADTTTYAIVSSKWIDEYTLELTSDTIATRPAIVTLEYTGPDVFLETAWHKQWEPFGPIPSTDLTATLWKTGMIILWSGSIATIPSGWALCNGSNGTPDLRNNFIVGAGTTYAVGTTGGALTHRHNVNGSVVFNLSAGVVLKQLAPTGNYNPSGTSTLQTASEYTNGLPPYYALAYIMKL
jgi:hypothetical protein